MGAGDPHPLNLTGREETNRSSNPPENLRVSLTLDQTQPPPPPRRGTTIQFDSPRRDSSPGRCTTTFGSTPLFGAQQTPRLCSALLSLASSGVSTSVWRAVSTLDLLGSAQPRLVLAQHLGSARSKNLGSAWLCAGSPHPGTAPRCGT
jgi:hypothetical protein